MCSDALGFDSDIARNVVRDQKHILDAYARAKAYIDVYYPDFDYDLKLRQYNEIKITKNYVEKRALFMFMLKKPVICLEQ